jgi:hypothetical protein
MLRVLPDRRLPRGGDALSRLGLPKKHFCGWWTMVFS